MLEGELVDAAEVGCCSCSCHSPAGPAGQHENFHAQLTDRTGKWDSEGKCLNNGTCTDESASLCRESVELEKGTMLRRRKKPAPIEDLVDVGALEELEKAKMHRRRKKPVVTGRSCRCRDYLRTYLQKS